MQSALVLVPVKTQSWFPCYNLPRDLDCMASPFQVSALCNTDVTDHLCQMPWRVTDTQFHNEYMTTYNNWKKQALLEGQAGKLESIGNNNKETYLF